MDHLFLKYLIFPQNSLKLRHVSYICFDSKVECGADHRMVGRKAKGPMIIPIHHSFLLFLTDSRLFPVQLRLSLNPRRLLQAPSFSTTFTGSAVIFLGPCLLLLALWGLSPFHFRLSWHIGDFSCKFIFFCRRYKKQQTTAYNTTYNNVSSDVSWCYTCLEKLLGITEGITYTNPLRDIDLFCLYLANFCWPILSSYNLAMCQNCEPEILFLATGNFHWLIVDFSMLISDFSILLNSGANFLGSSVR